MASDLEIGGHLIEPSKLPPVTLLNGYSHKPFTLFLEINQTSDESVPKKGKNQLLLSG